LAKLTADRVRKIRERHARGETQKALGYEFGVSRSAIGKVVRGKTWAT
jgi:transcriptional regulator with XRE-family HTH domain